MSNTIIQSLIIFIGILSVGLTIELIRKYIFPYIKIYIFPYIKIFKRILVAKLYREKFVVSAEIFSIEFPENEIYFKDFYKKLELLDNFSKRAVKEFYKDKYDSFFYLEESLSNCPTCFLVLEAHPIFFSSDSYRIEAADEVIVQIGKYIAEGKHPCQINIKI